MTKPPRRLRFELELASGESVPGAIARATHGHHLERLGAVLREAGLPSKYPGATQLLDPGSLGSLAGVIRCDPAALAGRAGRRLGKGEQHLARHYVAFGELVLPRFFLDLQVRRVAPQTLAAAPHHRDDWLITVLPYCPTSLERLVSRCRTCGGTLGWRRTSGIGRCETCDTQLPPSDEPMLAAADAADYRVFAGLASLSGGGRDEAYAALPERMRALQPGDLVRLAIKWGLEVANEDQNVISAWQTRATKLPAERLAAVVVSGVRLLRSWPESVRGIPSEAPSPGASTIASLRRRLRRMAEGDGGYAARFDLVQDALSQEAIRDAGAFTDGRRTYSGREVRRLLPSTAEHMKDLRTAGLVPYAGPKKGAEVAYRYCADAIDTLVALAGDAVSFGVARERLGLPVYALEQLHCAGLLAQIEDPAIDILLRRRMTSASALDRLEADLMYAASSLAPPAQVLPISRESRRIGGRQKPWSAMYLAMLQGDLPFWVSDRPHVQCLLIRPGSLDEYVHTRFDCSDHAGVRFSQHMDTRDAAEILNVAPATILRLAGATILKSEMGPRSRRLLRSEVEDLARCYVSTGELARSAKTSASAIEAKLRKFEQRDPVSKMWRRDVEREWLTSKQA